jgi:hypothetical protein
VASVARNAAFDSFAVISAQALTGRSSCHSRAGLACRARIQGYAAKFVGRKPLGSRLRGNDAVGALSAPPLRAHTTAVIPAQA